MVLIMGVMVRSLPELSELERPLRAKVMWLKVSAGLVWRTPGEKGVELCSGWFLVARTEAGE